MIVARAENNQVFLYDGDRLVLKAYASSDAKMLRVVLPELENFAQTRIRPDVHVVDFERDARAAKRSIK